MSFRINTNVMALGAYRNLAATGSDLGKSITRLSTGLRINSAADDPAGLIASEGFRAQISSMDQALRNNQDALNYAKTADGALDEVNRLLRDARALAVANGSSTLDAAQKQANQTQLNNILSSITRISSNTQFGTKKLLNGSAGTTGTINDTGNFASVNLSGTFSGNAMTVNGVMAVNVTTSAEQATVTGTATYAAGTTAVGAGTLTVNGYTFTTNAGTTRDQLIQMINDRTSETGVYAAVNGSNNVVLTSVDYGTDKTVTVTNTANLFSTAAGTSSDAGANAVASVTYNGSTVTFNSGTGLNLKDTYGNSIKLSVSGNRVNNYTNPIQVNAGSSSFQIGANGGQTASLSLGNFSSASLGLGSIDITGTDITTALSSIDSAIESVSASRGTIGSFMRNTVESNVRSLAVTKENLAATESAIRDVDVAEEMTAYTKLQILQQSGLSMLAQANSMPQSVLALLR
jgi:flagellin